MSHEELGSQPQRSSAQLPGSDAQTGRLVPDGVATPPPRRRSVPGLGPRATRPPTTLVRVLLCEDQEVFRLGLRVVLEAQPDMAVVAETAHLPGAVAAADDVGTQVVVVRQGLVGGGTLPLLRDLCQRGTAVLVLAESGDEAESELVDVLQAGVRGYLPRRSAAQRVVEGVRALARHEPALDPSATSELVRYLTRPAVRRSGSEMRALERLTDRQREVAELVAQGMSNEEIAGRLFLSLATVKSHLTASMRRLDVRTRTQLAILVNRDHPPAA
jgi:DNA-binding NarL/FixJ family response regulator